MKKLLYLYSFIIIAFSCNKSNCNLPEETIGSAEIIANAEITQFNILEVDFNKEYIINSDSANTINAQVKFNNGTTDSINLTNYTLLGKWASGGCNVVIERDMERKDSEKKIIYSLKVTECGNCEKEVGSMNWVLVHKIPEDYTVEFIVN